MTHIVYIAKSDKVEQLLTGSCCQIYGLLSRVNGECYLSSYFDLEDIARINVECWILYSSFITIRNIK